jgi:hypothetical protein
LVPAEVILSRRQHREDESREDGGRAGEDEENADPS